MCSPYQGIKERERYFKQFGVMPPTYEGKFDVWPGHAATATSLDGDAGRCQSVLLLQGIHLAIEIGSLFQQPITKGFNYWIMLAFSPRDQEIARSV